jgi:hypothetical protein
MTYSILGIDAAGRPVIINQAARREGLHIIGLSGGGKSGLLENLATQDINQDLGICVLDAHRRSGEANNDLTMRVIERMEYESRHADKPQKRERMKRRLAEDVIFLDIRDPVYVFGLNLFHCDNLRDPFAQEDTLELVMHFIKKVYGITDQNALMYQDFLNITRTLLFNPQCTILDIPDLLLDEAFRKQLLTNVPDAYVQKFWKEIYPKRSRVDAQRGFLAVMDKLDSFFRPTIRPIVGQPQPTIRLPDIMNQGKILLIRLGSEWEHVTSLVGTMIISLILHATFARGNSPKRFDNFNVYVDEFQKFANEDFVTLLNEARKYKISLTVAHQIMEQLDRTMRAACKAAGNIVVFQVSADNAKEIAATFVDEERHPGPPRREPLRTPVMEPLQFMRRRGTHPGSATRHFMEHYGRLLVDEAKREEREYQREMDQYGYDSVAQSEAASPDTVPSSLFREMLAKLNGLFYKAMEAGEQGQNPDDLPLPDEQKFDNLIWAVVPEQREFLDAWNEYLSSGEDRSGDPADLAARKEALNQQLADLLAYQQKRQETLRQEFEAAQEHLTHCMQAYLRAEVSIVRAICVIVRRGSLYYIATLNHNWPTRSEDSWYYEINYQYHEQPEDPETTRRDLTPDNSFDTPRSLAFASLEAAVFYFWRQMKTHPVWFRAERATGDPQWWQYHRDPVYCQGRDFPSWITSAGIEELDVWLLKPEVEQIWYNASMLEEEVERRLQDREQPRNDAGIDFVKSIAGSFRWTSSPIGESLRDVEQASKTFEEVQYHLQGDTYTLAQKVKQETERINHELGLIEIIEQQRSSYEACEIELKELLRQVMRELAEAPVEDESGLTQLISTDLPASEVEARIARELHRQPKYQAHVRTTEGPNIITTLPPGDGISEQELLALAEEIKQQNLKAGYLRRRGDVEREIASRQQPPDEPPPPPTRPHPPSSPPPAPMRRRKKVL